MTAAIKTNKGIRPIKNEPVVAGRYFRLQNRAPSLSSKVLPHIGGDILLRDVRLKAMKGSRTMKAPK
jgi:hypothetical protein